MYQGIKILLATKHNKEVAIKPAFEHRFQAQIDVPNDFDTDQYGTFSGEIKRNGTPLETVIQKAQDAMLRYDYQFAIASEGSFGPHPLYFFMPTDIELMVFLDRSRNLTITESEVAMENNFSYLDIHRHDDYSAFLLKMKFGTHGLIIKNVYDDTIIAKGITQHQKLESILHASFGTVDTIRLETDMRAMMNPTRMQVIHTLANKLVTRLANTCPKCETPGFGKVSVQGKLPCEDCGSETELYQSKVLNCIQCDHTEILPREDGLAKAEVRFCPCCNP